MKQKNVMLMVVAIGCGLVAAFLTAKLSGGSKDKKVDLIVAKKELPVGTLLEEKELENMVGIAQFPEGNVPPDSIMNVEELKGKRLNRTLKPGNPFSQGDVAMDSGIKIPEGMYKYAIKIDGVKAVAGFVQPGDHVDVQLTESLPDGRARAGFVLRDVLVLAVDTASRRREGGQEAVQQVNSVSLAVTSKHSLFLSAAEKRGEVKLVLRDNKDLDKKDIEPIVKIPGIDKDAKSEAPVALPTRTLSVIVAKTEVPVNTFITNDNFDQFFIKKEIPEEAVPGKAIKDQESLRGKYITNKLEADMIVFGTWLSDNKLEAPTPQVATVEQPKVEAPQLEVLPTPREEKPLYPRKFEQIINNQRVWFMEISPGEFRRVDGNGAELKDLPAVGGALEKKDEKKDENRGDRAA